MKTIEANLATELRAAADALRQARTATARLVFENHPVLSDQTEDVHQIVFHGRTVVGALTALATRFACEESETIEEVPP
jgi:hypothetical protein